MSPMIAWAIGTSIYSLAAYVYGLRILPHLIAFPIQSWKVCRFVFVVLVSFITVRSCITLFAHPHLFDWGNTLEAYSDACFTAVFVMLGYDNHQVREPLSIKGSLAIAEDGGLHILDPFTAVSDVSLPKGHDHDKSR